MNVEIEMFLYSSRMEPFFDICKLYPMNMMNIKIKMTLYRRSTESFLIFENYIRSFWWGKLHPFKDRMVARASKSVNQFRDYIDIMTNQISHLRDIEIKGLKYSNSYSSEQLNHLIQQLSLIETMKINLINAILTWIMCDGRDIVTRKQRLSHVATHVKLIIVENFNNLTELCLLKIDNSLIETLNEKFPYNFDFTLFDTMLDLVERTIDCMLRALIESDKVELALFGQPSMRYIY